MARIKRYAPRENLSDFQTFILDTNPNSDYFRITEFKDNLTGGKNGFLIEGSEHLKETTEIKIEITDVEGNPVYFEAGTGVPSYFEGVSRVVSIFVYSDTPIGLGKVTILGELKSYIENSVVRNIPDNWKGVYNVKWERNVKINRNVLNSDKVRFYEKPDVTIEELVKPIYSKTIPVKTQNGIVGGIALASSQPILLEAEDSTNPKSSYSTFDRNIVYKLIIDSKDSFVWNDSMIGQQVNIPDIDYNPTLIDVLNEKEAIVDPPYEINKELRSFKHKNFSIEYSDLNNAVYTPTEFNAPFAKISFDKLNTFVGSVGRVRIFRRSQSQIADYKFIEEVPIISNELLMDIQSPEDKIYYGNFTNSNILSKYWTSNNTSVSLDSSRLQNSVKLSSTGVGNFFTKPVEFVDIENSIQSRNISIVDGIEYTINFNIRKYKHTSDNDYIKVYLEEDNGNTHTITNIRSSDFLMDVNSVSHNCITGFSDDSLDREHKCSLRFEVVGLDWYINRISLKSAQERSFSPGRISVIQDVPRTLQKETFDFRFDFYDINNNYIPILIERTATFERGSPSAYRSLSIRPRQYFFIFDSNDNPKQPTKIVVDIIKILIPEDVTFTSGAYDIDGNLIPVSDYVDGGYPGLLKEITPNSASLEVNDFLGSNPNNRVQYIRYTGTAGDLFDSFTISRVDEPTNNLQGLLRLRPRQHNFVFDPYTNAHPITNIIIDIDKILIDGDITFTSAAYDVNGEYIPPSEFAGSEYPGRLTDIENKSANLPVEHFTGSIEDITVQYIRYEARVGNYTDVFSISRIEESLQTGSGEFDQELFSKNYQTDNPPDVYKVRVGDNWFEKRTNSHFRLVQYHYNNEFDTTFDNTFSVTERRYWIETTSPPGTEHLLRTFRNSFDYTFDRCEECFEPTVWDYTFDDKFGNKAIFLVESENYSHLL
jgi:hypothetical protein